MQFSESLDHILTENSEWESMNIAMDLLSKLSTANQMVSNIKHQIKSIMLRMSSDLALNIRRYKPSLNVGLYRNGKCKIGFRSKSIIIYPDVEKGIWIADSSDNKFLNMFLKYNRKKLLMSNNLDQLVEAIADFFTSYYKSIGEEVTGCGIIIIEDKIGTLKDLVEFSNSSKVLLSRATKTCIIN